MSGTSPMSGTPSVSAASRPPPSPKIRVSSPQWGQTKLDMFSMTPIGRRFVRSAILPARSATRRAASCGVVTTSIAAPGRNDARLIDTSPVPGGRSTSRKSRSPQYTSPRNCSIALCSMGPRQMTGVSSGTKKPIEMTFTP